MSAVYPGADRSGGGAVARAAASGAPAPIDWSAILAGALLASAVGFVLMSFGTGLGLSVGGQVGGEQASPRLVAITVGLWTMWVVVSSFMAGGYLTGRMRRRALDASAHEVHVRDGAHGLVVWALGVLVAGYLTAAGVTSVAGAGVKAISGASSAVASSVASASNPMDYIVDLMFRSENDATGDPQALRSQTVRIVTCSVQSGDLSQPDRDYLTAVVARETGLDRAQAQSRVDAAVSSAKEAAEKARAAAEKARRTGILASFLIAALLLVSAVGAWWASTIGGRHRDEGTDFSRFVRWN